jgi:acetyl-CoA C-acetyltransferase
MTNSHVYILGGARTAQGSYMGALSQISAPKLGAVAIEAALDNSKISKDQVQEVFMGNVVQAGVGQAPARQAALFAKLPESVPATTINKVCGSGLQSIIFAAKSIMTDGSDVVIAGGMENMSLAPHLILNSRTGMKFGSTELKDSMQWDGLWDVYSNRAMGNCAEECVKKYNFSRQEMDAFAIESFKRSQKAIQDGIFKNEIATVTIQDKKGDIQFSQDEGPFKANFEKIPTLKPAFEKDGAITAANASTINDGAAALILMSEEKANALGLKALAYIKSYADAAHEPKWFTTAPAKALPKALDKAGLKTTDIDFFEFNEAFSVVGLANAKILGLPNDKVNVNGGAVSLGHPLGCSGARIIVTLLNVLEQNNAKLGAAAICNGGGGASAIVIERA